MCVSMCVLSCPDRPWRAPTPSGWRGRPGWREGGGGVGGGGRAPGAAGRGAGGRHASTPEEPQLQGGGAETRPERVLRPR